MSTLNRNPSHKETQNNGSWRRRPSHSDPAVSNGSRDDVASRTPHHHRRQICRYFRDKGTCRFGTGCHFDHDVSSSPPDPSSAVDPPRPPRRTDEHRRAREQLLSLSGLCQREGESKFRAQRRAFYKTALELLASEDDGIVQQAVAKMASNGGLGFVRETATAASVAPRASSAATSSLIPDEVHPLLRILSHPRLCDSAVLEQQAAALHTFFMGPSGSRMTRVFQFVIEYLSSSSSLSSSHSWDDDDLRLVECSLTTLVHAIDYTTSLALDDTTREIVSLFDRLLVDRNTASAAADPSSQFQLVRALDYLKRRFEMGSSLPQHHHLHERADAATGSRAVFTPTGDLPGEMSSDGPRHDNDHVKISSIRILPTAGEILSVRDEYLPTTDPSRGHLRGIRWLIDRHFRLLRKDTVGQLVQAVRSELASLRGVGGPGADDDATRRRRNEIRTLSYRDARVEAVQFDAAAAGLELVVSFPQPRPAAAAGGSGSGTKKRQDWWESSKRLQAGALVCLVDLQQGQGMQNVLFCSVAAARRPSAAENSDPADGEPPQPPPAQPTLWGDRRRASVPLHLADPAEHNIASALQWPVDGLNGGNRALVLVEFPGVLLASFQATLATLQDMFRAPQLPFVDLLVPDDTKNGEALSIPPPQYARRPGFAFDLREITTNHDHAQPPLWFRPGDADLDAHVRRLVDSSSLDPSQARAVLESLSRELALIEGPPGTGKSYTGEAIIKTLLATNRNRNGTEAGLGPILLVCYTNHALDQLMEHLHRGGVEGMIRIGGQSQSDVLQDINLRVVARDARKTAIEMDQIRACKRLVETGKQRMHHLLGQLQRCHSAEGLREYLKEHHGTSYSAIFGDGDDDGDGDGDDDNEDVWVQVGRRRHNHPSSRLGRWLHGGGSRTETTTTSPRENNVALEEAELSDVVLEETETNPWSLSPRERERLYRHWQERHRRTLADQILAAHEAWRSARAQMDCVHREVDGRCLRQAQVIGVTTTGLARHVELLRKLRCKVVVCEEAGEVLEAHLLTALLPSVEHAILIGDHLQLRPQIQDYSLQTVNPAGAKYALDVSLFERLVRPFADHTPALPYSTLLTQRRMHPDIARLVRETLYPDLEDAVAVARYPPVAGMRQRLFWLHHEHEEQGRNSSGSGDDPTSTSVSNEWEAAMALELVAYLTRQGAYKPGDIAVLVPYLAQLRLLRRVFEGRFEVLLNDRDAGDLEEEADEPDAPEPGTSVGEEARPPKAPLAKASLSRSVRLATVDNFQGEEAQVVVVSLVRSNRENRPGFLRVSNRINVLLSRARHGLFILGNAHTAAAVDMWARVLRILKENKPGSFGTALELRCARHPEARLLVREPGDFARLAPDGGCHLPCDRRLDCGHRCAGRCHADHLHRVFRCVEPCSRRRRGGGCDHPCPRECGQPCEDNCSLLLRDLDLPLPCGHRVTSAPCWQAQDPSSIQCRVLVEKTVPGCGHVVSVACHVNVEGPDYACLAECAAVLPCGHQCRQKCILCQPARSHPTHDETTTPPPAPPPVMHGPCRAICGRGYTTCKHTCQEACHDGVGCPPCRAPCEVRCSHSRCPKRCHEPCAVCAEEDCSSRCPHSQCSLPCAAPCDWVPCSRRCEKTLACGHQCPSLCGETCPDVKFCQTCAPSDVRGTVVDLLEMREYSEVNLDEEPCLFLACGHIFTRTTLDGQMDLSQHYTLSAEGHPVAVAPASRRSSVDPVKLCPECRGPLRSLSRYGRIIRQAMLDELTKRYVAWSHTEFTLLGSALLDARSQLGSSSSSSRPAQELLPTAGGRAGQLDIRGSPSDVVRVVSEWTGHGYFRSVLVVRRRIEAYARKVRVEEQPLWRVAELVAHARRNQSAGGADMPPVDESQLQTSGSVKAAALLLRCDLFVLTEFMRLWQTVRDAQAAIQMDLSGHKERCAALIAAAEKQSRHQHTVEGYVFLAQCCTLERCVQPHDGAGSAASDARRRNADLQHEAQGALETARRVSRQYPATTEAVQCDIEATAKMVQGLGFYAPVSDEELRSIYHAVGFSTGHWYECENGHLFVVGECGMPMELARCHECGRPVGGQNHDPAHGVRRAHELEEMATGVRAVDLDA